MITLVIGVGNGGIKILKTLNEMVQATEEIPQYRFIAIDSNGEDIQKHVGSLKNTTQIVISDVDFNVRDIQNGCPYLYSGVQGQKGGALRERGYGRFLYDLHRPRVETIFLNNLTEIKEEWIRSGIGNTQGHLLIWIVHALGGGTGSGTFPSLVQHISDLAQNAVRGLVPGIVPHLFCVGILPSGSNIADITNVQFNPKYLANSLGALEEIKILANASPNNPVSITPFPQGRTIVSTRRPFERYFFFGIKEDMVSKLKEEQVKEARDYLSDGNKVIATMMYSIPLHTGGIENLWLEYPGPFIVFGESELFIPLNDIKIVAEENDILGKPIKDNQSLNVSINREVAVTAGIPDSEINETILETRATDVFNTYRLRGLSHYLGKIQYEYLLKVSNAQNDLETTLKNYLERLGSNEVLMQWYQDALKNMPVSSVTSVNKARALIDALIKKKEDFEEILNHILIRANIWKKEDIKERIRTIDEIVKIINTKIEIYRKYQRMKLYIDNEIGINLPISAVKQNCGVPKIVEYINQRSLDLDQIKNELSIEGRGRVTSVPLAREKLDSLSLKDEKTNITGMNSIPAFIRSMGIDDNRIRQIIQNRITQAKTHDMGVEYDLTIPGSRPRTPEIAILCNEINDQILGEHRNLLADVILELLRNDVFSSERLSFVHFILNIEIDDILEYRNRKMEYDDDGRLQKEAQMTEPVATIFAHPEWFNKDPLVLKAFPNLK